MPEALFSGIGISMFLIEIVGSKWLNIDNDIVALCFYYIIFPSLMQSLLLLIQGTFIKMKKVK